MNLRAARALFVAVAVAAGSMAGCEASTSPPSQTQAPTPSPSVTSQEVTGTIGLNLQIGSGVSISTVNWTIHNPTLLASDLTGSVNVSQSQAIQFVVGGLPAGSGYTITLTATTDGPNPLNCLGSGMFSIMANATSQVNVTLVCSSNAPADAGNTGSVSVIVTPQIAPACAAVTSLSASPATVDVGGSLTLMATGIDNSGSSASVGFSWAVSGGTGTGTFSDASSASPSFTCTGAGPVTVTVTATDAGGASCTNNTASVALTCTPAGGGGGSTGGTDSGAPGPDAGGTGSEDAGPPDEGPPDTGAPDTGVPDTGAADTAAPDAGVADAGAPDTGVADTGAPDTGTADAVALDTGVADTGSPDASVTDAGTQDTGPADTGTADASDGGGPGCDPTNPQTTTQTCIAAQNKPVDPSNPSTHCAECVQSNGCYDPSLMGGTCETIAAASSPVPHLAGPIGDGGPTCASVIGTEPVSETKICLQTLQGIFSSKCGASLQLTPCLCGSTDPTTCTAGTATPTGPLYDEYSCDFDSTSGSTINTDFIVPTFGAGMANSIAQCAGSFMCDCF